MVEKLFKSVQEVPKAEKGRVKSAAKIRKSVRSFFKERQGLRDVFDNCTRLDYCHGVF